MIEDIIKFGADNNLPFSDEEIASLRDPEKAVSILLQGYGLMRTGLMLGKVPSKFIEPAMQMSQMIHDFFVANTKI